MAWTEAHNVCTDEPRIVIALMRAVADLSARCRRPAYAFTIAWHADENPTPDAMKAVAYAVLERAGFVEHQVFVICPADRVHPCVRIVVNRIHPVTGKAWPTSFDYRRLEMIARLLAAEHGFRHVDRHRAKATPA